MDTSKPKKQSGPPPKVPKNQPAEAGEANIPAAGNPQTVAILCDACKQDVGSPQRIRKPLKRGIIDVGLACPHCGFWVHLHYSSPELELAYTILMRFKAKAGLSRIHRQRFEQKVSEFVRKEARVKKLGGG